MKGQSSSDAKRVARKIGSSMTVLYEINDQATLLRCTQLDHNPKAMMAPLHARIEFVNAVFHEITVVGRIVEGHGLVKGSTSQHYRFEAEDQRYLLETAPPWVQDLVQEARFAALVEPAFGAVE